MATKSDTSGKRNLPTKSKSHWNNGLLSAMKDPKQIVLEDELTVCIRDKYPKATFHYLICPKEDVATLKNVKFEHLYLLKHMHGVGEKLSGKHKSSNFLMGYHSIPSMVRLHLHVISDDFDSQCLKTKKHWNSFTTEFFLPSNVIISELEANGKINHKPVAECKLLIQKPLKCHKCEYKPKNMQDLKHHLKTHLK